MVRKVNGTHVTLEPALRKGRGNRHALAKAMAAVRSAAKRSALFKDIKGHNLVLIIDAALQDAFVPIPKIKVKKQGDRLQHALKTVREGQKYHAPQTSQTPH